jgi:nucleoside-diphosphate-sugar epimerase
MNQNKAVVLGASGFIGTRLVRSLVEQGVTGIRAVDILPPRERLDGVDYRTLDVREPIPDEVGAGASIIYNFAAVHRTPGHPANEYFETNVAGAINAARLADSCGVKTILFTSSISVYGPSEETVSESSPLRPVSSYGRSKRLAEQIHEQWLRQGAGRRLVVVRPGVVFGPGERGNYTHLAKALRGGYFLYPGRRDAIKSGGYVDELLRTMNFALNRDEAHILYNFAYPELSTTQDIVATFGEVLGRRSNPPTLPVAPLLLAASVFEVADALGFKNWIHRDRVRKLVQSTKVAPDWLVTNRYNFSSDLKTALEHWHAETAGQFV